jgi:hypothetical protein
MDHLQATYMTLMADDLEDSPDGRRAVASMTIIEALQAGLDDVPVLAVVPTVADSGWVTIKTESSNGAFFSEVAFSSDLSRFVLEVTRVLSVAQFPPTTWLFSTVRDSDADPGFDEAEQPACDLVSQEQWDAIRHRHHHDVYGAPVSSSSWLLVRPTVVRSLITTQSQAPTRKRSVSAVSSASTPSTPIKRPRAEFDFPDFKPFQARLAVLSVPEATARTKAHANMSKTSKQDAKWVVGCRTPKDVHNLEVCREYLSFVMPGIVLLNEKYWVCPCGPTVKSLPRPLALTGETNPVRRHLENTCTSFQKLITDQRSPARTLLVTPQKKVSHLCLLRGT